MTSSSSLLLDPEHTLTSQLTSALTTVLAAISPAQPLAVMLLQRRNARHVHGVMDNLAQSSSPSLATYLARLQSVATAADARIGYNNVHPFRPNLSLSQAELQLGAPEGSVASNCIRILISWHERRLRAEIPDGAASPDLFSKLLRSVAQKSQTENASQERFVELLSQACDNMHTALRVLKWVKRIGVVLAVAVVGFFVVRWVRRLLRRKAVLLDRIDTQTTHHTQPCCICLEDDSAQQQQQRQQQLVLQQQQQQQQQQSSSSSSAAAAEGNSNSSSNAEEALMNEEQLITSASTWVRLACDHSMHLACVSEWLSRHSTCPMCRRPDEELAAVIRCGPLTGSGTNNIIGAAATTGVWGVLRATADSVRYFFRMMVDTADGRAIMVNVLFHLLPRLASVLMKLVLRRNLLEPAQVLELSF